MSAIGARPTRSVLALFAKEPVPGRVKTRLCPPLQPEQAAQLYTAMLLDILEQHAAQFPEGGPVDLALWYTPAEGRPWFERHAPSRYALVEQRGPDLPARLKAVFHTHAEQGYGRIAVRGTDSPTLPLPRVAEALDRLERCDAVLCPDRDGGYNLVGLREPCDALFDVEMSTAQVLARTLERADALGLSLTLLEPHHDVDTSADLERLEQGLPGTRAPRTRAWLRELRPTGR